MLRLPDNPDEWTPSVHTSGRHFITNNRTSETRWLWQKWDVDGRLFVRNISDPEVRLWVDEMDLPARIAAGTATHEELEQYQRSQQVLPPPPPPPLPPPHLQPYHQPPPNFPPPQHLPHGFAPEHPHVAPQQPPYPNYPNHGTSYLAPLSHTQPFDPALADGAPRLESPNVSNDLLIQPPMDNRHQPLFPSNNERHRFPPRGHVLDRIRMRREELDNAGPSSGRYWSSAANRQRKKAKRHHNGDFDNQNRSDSDLVPAPAKPPRLYRHPPLPLMPGEFVVKRGGEGMRLSKLAKQFYDAAVDKEDYDDRIAALYQRDFMGDMANGTGSPCSVRAQNGEGDSIHEAVVGTCLEVEKEYLRLTTAPRPEMIRPPSVLKESLSRIKMFWATGVRDYDWVCKQLKSVRQDFKVQHVENKDVVDVYETHARIALERSDLGEFNTCVAQVQELYKKVGQIESVQDEFMSYRILYNLLVGAREWEQGKILAQFSSAERTRPATSFALLIRQTIISGNYHQYFRLCFNPPPKTMISYLLVNFHDDMRCRALSTIAAAYGPGQPGYVPLSFIFDQLGWRAEHDDIEGAEHEQIRQEFEKKSVESGLSSLFDSLNMLEQPSWFLKALTFLITVGAVLVVDNKDKPALSKIHLNCKATKATGIKALNASKKLITHAGS